MWKAVGKDIGLFPAFKVKECNPDRYRKTAWSKAAPQRIVISSYPCRMAMPFCEVFGKCRKPILWRLLQSLV